MNPAPLPGSPLRLGTRRSPLALAQSTWVARQLETLHPGLRVELVGVETRGDQLLDVPLSTAPGREFFVAELDSALLARKVDFTVHSFKDLSLDRPADLVLAAVPIRADPRDVVLYGPSASTRLSQGHPLRIGTGSPRRIANVGEFLPGALPGANPQPPPEFVSIRGNVDTRLSRIHLANHEERHLDAVILALAGLSRLALSAEGRARLAKLLSGVRSMVLPLSECPTAPAQGALAVECRADDPATRQILAVLHHPETAHHVAREREILAEWGGGCHQALGATSRSIPGTGSVLHIRGRRPDGTSLRETRVHPAAPSAPSVPSVSAIVLQAVPPPSVLLGLPEKRVWAGTLEVWSELARKGVWVEGCDEGPGAGVVESLGPGPAEEAPSQIPEPARIPVP
ncbi:MAG: hydroxymethylbilane synthase [Limisphaerales bacterium]